MSIAFGESGQMAGNIDIPSLPVGMASIVSVATSDAATAEDVAQAIMDALVQPIPLSLPYGIELDTLTVETPGLRLTAAAAGLQFPLE